MKPKWQNLASLAQETCTLWFQFFGAVFAFKGYPFKNIFVKHVTLRAGPILPPIRTNVIEVYLIMLHK